MIVGKRHTGDGALVFVGAKSSSGAFRTHAGLYLNLITIGDEYGIRNEDNLKLKISRAFISISSKICPPFLALVGLCF